MSLRIVSSPLTLDMMILGSGVIEAICLREYALNNTTIDVNKKASIIKAIAYYVKDNANLVNILKDQYTKSNGQADKEQMKFLTRESFAKYSAEVKNYLTVDFNDKDDPFATSSSSPNTEQYVKELVRTFCTTHNCLDQADGFFMVAATTMKLNPNALDVEIIESMNQAFNKSKELEKVVPTIKGAISAALNIQADAIADINEQQKQGQLIKDNREAAEKLSSRRVERAIDAASSSNPKTVDEFIQQYKKHPIVTVGISLDPAAINFVSDVAGEFMSSKGLMAGVTYGKVLDFTTALVKKFEHIPKNKIFDALIKMYVIDESDDSSTGTEEDQEVYGDKLREIGDFLRDKYHDDFDLLTCPVPEEILARFRVLKYKHVSDVGFRIAIDNVAKQIIVRKKFPSMPRIKGYTYPDIMSKEMYDRIDALVNSFPIEIYGYKREYWEEFKSTLIYDYIPMLMQKFEWYFYFQPTIPYNPMRAAILKLLESWSANKCKHGRPEYRFMCGQTINELSCVYHAKHYTRSMPRSYEDYSQYLVITEDEYNATIHRPASTEIDHSWKDTTKLKNDASKPFAFNPKIVRRYLPTQFMNTATYAYLHQGQYRTWLSKVHGEYAVVRRPHIGRSNFVDVLCKEPNHVPRTMANPVYYNAYAPADIATILNSVDNSSLLTGFAFAGLSAVYNGELSLEQWKDLVDEAIKLRNDVSEDSIIKVLELAYAHFKSIPVNHMFLQ